MKNDRQSGWIDIHSHLLPLLDDGAANQDQCLAAARCYLRSGFETVIATPHYMAGTKWETAPAVILDTVQQMATLLNEQEIPLKILPGMEIMLTEHICRNFDPDQFLPLGADGFYLLELPANSPFITSYAEGLEHLLSLEGLHFVLAHPERCRAFNDNPEWLEFLVGRGALIQLNLGSLLGRSGHMMQQKAFEFLEAGLVHFLASDTHARKGRMPPDTDEMTTIHELLGKEIMDHAFKRNPERLLAGKKVDPLVPDGKIDYGAELHARQGGYMQKLKDFFTHN